MKHLYLLLCIIVALSCSQPAPRRAPEPIAEARLPQIRVGILPDESRSMREARIARVTTESLEPVFDRLRKSGGEVAFGFIRERSDQPFLRLRVSPPPIPPKARTVPANIFAAAAARKEDDAARDRYRALHDAWRKDADKDIQAFKEAVAPLLARDNDAPATDIRSAIIRSDLFLAEPWPYTDPPANVVVFITDGFETVSPEALPLFRSPAEVLLVNGSGSTGGLTALHPTRFEALDAALRFAVREGGSHVRAN